MVKPVHFVAAARFALLAGSLTVAALTLGPFQGAEGHFGLTDKEAHAIAFGGLLANNVSVQFGDDLARGHGGGDGHRGRHSSTSMVCCWLV